jgi:hypothetical protein
MGNCRHSNTHQFAIEKDGGVGSCLKTTRKHKTLIERSMKYVCNDFNDLYKSVREGITPHVINQSVDSKEKCKAYIRSFRKFGAHRQQKPQLCAAFIKLFKLEFIIKISCSFILQLFVEKLVRERERTVSIVYSWKQDNGHCTTVWPATEKLCVLSRNNSGSNNLQGINISEEAVRVKRMKGLIEAEEQKRIG